MRGRAPTGPRACAAAAGPHVPAGTGALRRLGTLIVAGLLGWTGSMDTAPAQSFDVRSRALVFSGPYQAEMVQIIDGDTVVARVAVWPGLIAEYSVRVRGIDTPEVQRPDCAEERAWGERARAQVERLYPPGSEIRLRDVQFDAFSGRVLADVQRFRSDRWLSLSSELLQRGLAVEWHPSQGAVPWCLLAQSPPGDEAADDAQSEPAGN